MMLPEIIILTKVLLLVVRELKKKSDNCTVEFDDLIGQGKVKRRMLPLILCCAETIRKLQGTTIDIGVVDINTHVSAKGQAHSVFSRVRTLERLALSSLDPKRL